MGCSRWSCTTVDNQDFTVLWEEERFPVQPEVSSKAVRATVSLDAVGMVCCSIELMWHHAVTHPQHCMFPKSL